MIVQIPIDLIIYIIYIPVALNSWSLIGIAAAFVIFPIIAVLMGKVIYI